MKKNTGITFVELAIVIALMGIIGMMGTVFFRQTFDVWWTTRDIVDIQSDARIALDEMSRFVRQASTETITPAAGVQGESIKFKIGKSTTEWSHADRRINYFKSGNTLRRFMKGSTTTLVGEGITVFHIVHSTDSRYELIKIDLEVTKGGEKADFSRNVVLRGRPSE